MSNTPKPVIALCPSWMKWNFGIFATPLTEILYPIPDLIRPLPERDSLGVGGTSEGWGKLHSRQPLKHYVVLIDVSRLIQYCFQRSCRQLPVSLPGWPVEQPCQCNQLSWPAYELLRFPFCLLHAWQLSSTILFYHKARIYCGKQILSCIQAHQPVW